MTESLWIAPLEAACLVLAALWTLVPMATRGLARLFPRVFALLAGLLLAWCAGVVLLAVYAPAILHPLLLVMAVALAMSVFRARASHGAARGLPPGSLSLRGSIEALVDREFYRKRAARWGPIFKMAQFHQPVVCVVGLAHGRRLLHEHGQALGPSPLRFSREIEGGFLRYMDDGRHARYGPLFRRALSADVMDQSAPVVEDAIRRELASAATDARQTRGSVAPDACLERIVTGAFLRALFGVAAEEKAFDDLMHALRPLRSLGLSDRPTASTRAAVGELRRLLRDLHGDRSRAPVCALTELTRLDPQMPDDTCLDNLVFIHKITSSNVVGLLRWTLVMVSEHPRWLARLRSELQSGTPGGPPTLADRIVMETLRLSQAEYLYRRLTSDVAFEGFVFPSGWLVRICVWESHRMEAAFADAGRFDPDRFLGRDCPRASYVPFGADRHACNGVALTNLICRSVLQELTRAYDWRVAGHEPLQREFRHWSHWRPGSGLRLHLSPVSAARTSASATGPGRAAVAAGRPPL